MDSKPAVTATSSADTSKNPAAAAPRKRRRRAPATGATEDCFTCRKRQTKCDRKRPYCTQCIDMGKECSGYRTALTWGVGVASRGKLRGMTLPIARSAQVPTARERSRTPSTPSLSAAARQQPTLNAHSPFNLHSRTSAIDSFQSPLPSPSPSVQSFDLGMSSSNPIPIPHSMATRPPSAAGWHVSGFEEHVNGYNSSVNGKTSRNYFHTRPLHRLQTSLAPSYDETPLSASTGTLSTYGDSDYGSSGEYPPTPEDFSFVEQMGPPFAGPYLYAGAAVGSNESLSFSEAPRSYPAHSQHDDVSSSISSDRSFFGYIDGNSMHAVSMPVTTVQGMFYGPGLTAGGPSAHDFRFGHHFDNGRSAAEGVHGITSMAPDMAPISAPRIPRSYLPDAGGF